MTRAIAPHELPRALDAFADIEVLSLDCFDTLLWRYSHAPADVFSSLPGITPYQRGYAEQRARRAARFAHGRSEVTIAEIYAELLPHASPVQRRAGADAEWEAECASCYAFAPTVALMREARARGIKVVLVSDTYFDERQLKSLVARAGGGDVAALVDKVFCSSSFGRAKAEGLYGEVLRKLGAAPDKVLHIGDNHGADVGGVAPFGVNTVHLRQFTPLGEQRLRLEASMAAMLHPYQSGRATAPQPHRAALAAGEHTLSDASAHLGFAVLGPVLSGFDKWLQAEADQLAARGGTVHWLFLMRDGYLPLQVHLTRQPQAQHAKAAEISRFVATAASFGSAHGVRSYAEHELGLNPPTLARQMLLDEDEIDRLTQDAEPQQASLDLLAHVRRGDVARKIVRASRALADRLVAHVRACANPAPGDTLMLVDLGYNGSVQNEIDALLQRELKVHVAGRYLLLRERDCPGLDKRGYFGADHYDPHALEALTANVAVLEQLCTTETGSTIDYTDDGTPIRRANDIKGAQSAVRGRVQAGCLQFVRGEGQAMLCAQRAPDDMCQWREASAAALARLMYLPLGDELAAMARFEHDVNMGTERKVALFDHDEARRGMRSRGLFYLQGSERMYLPAELSASGLATRMTYLAGKRFGLRLNQPDFAGEMLSLPVIYTSSDNAAASTVHAGATHDGYYAAIVPIDDCRFSVALQFGALGEWIELESITVQSVAQLAGADSHDNVDQDELPYMLDGIEAPGPGLLHCQDEAGFMLVPPPVRRSDTKMALIAVFRPVGMRRAASSSHRDGDISVQSPPRQIAGALS